MSKLNVGVGEEFPVDSAETSPSDGDRGQDCRYPGYHRRGRRFRGYGRHRGPFFFVAPLVIIAFIAMISFAVSYPGIVLGLIALAAIAFALRHHHRWHDDDDGSDDRRGDWRDRRDDWRNRRDAGPQPDAPDSTAQGRV